MEDTIKRLVIRLEDIRSEIHHLRAKAEYPLTSKFERAEDAVEAAEKQLQDIID